MIFTHNIDPVILTLGSFDMRWYGVLFALGLLAYYLLIVRIFKREKYSLKDLESLVLFMFLGLLIGARLGHVFFYNAGYYLDDPVRILKVWEGGLASHGAAIGLFVAYMGWCLAKKVKFRKYLDVMAIPMPLAAAFVRFGNFFNSEIVGTPTDGSWGVIFKKLGEDFPRHPVQFYEAGVSLITFAVLYWLYKKNYKDRPPLFFVSLYLILYFGGRFVIEIWKNRHVVPSEFPLSMGQMLSIVPIVIGLIYFLFFFKKIGKRES